jgi:hypothetical protein
MDTVRVGYADTMKGYVRIFHREALFDDELLASGEDLQNLQVPVCEVFYPQRHCACGKAQVLWAGQEHVMGEREAWIQLTYRLQKDGHSTVLFHYECGRVTYGTNDIYHRRCGRCYRERLLKEMQK